MLFSRDLTRSGRHPRGRVGRDEQVDWKTGTGRGSASSSSNAPSCSRISPPGSPRRPPAVDGWCCWEARRAPARPRCCASSARSEPGARVLWGSCERLFTPRALGPFLDIAEHAGLDLGGFAPNRRVPHEFAGALVAELAHEAPTVLVVEDVHWADEGTLDVIKLLGRRIATLPVLALVSFRDDQLTADGALQIVLGELAGTLAAERRQIPPLSFEAVRTLAEPAGVDAARLFERTGGNPFFVTEALAAVEAHIPETVRDAVLARTAPLAPAPRRLLEAAAVVPATDRAVAARSRRRRGLRAAPGLPGLRDARARGRRGRVPARAGAARGRGRDRPRPAGRASPRGAAGADDGGTRAGRPGPPGPPRRCGRRRRGGRCVTRRSRASGPRRCAFTVRPPRSSRSRSDTARRSR